MRKRRSLKNRVPRKPTPPPLSESDFWFMVRGRIHSFSPRSGMVFCSVGGTAETRAAQVEFIRSHGRAFDTWAEVDAHAVARGWPNWKPRGD